MAERRRAAVDDSYVSHHLRENSHGAHQALARLRSSSVPDLQAKLGTDTAVIDHSRDSALLFRN